MGRMIIDLIVSDFFHKLRDLPVFVRTSLNMICIHDFGHTYKHVTVANSQANYIQSMNKSIFISTSHRSMKYNNKNIITN